MSAAASAIVTVRPAAFVLALARPEDAAALRAVVAAAFAQYEGVLDPPSGALAESDASLGEKIRAGGAWQCRHDDTIVGCAFVTPRADHLYLGRLAVVPAWRGQGIADLLLARVERQARELGLPSVQMGVRLALPRLLAWYAARGYELLEERAHPGYTTPTFAQLIKRLEPA
jgi:GNAT superfamily N-acetyltransferase